MSWSTFKPGDREIATARERMDRAKWAQNDAILRAQRGKLGVALGEYHLTAHERPIVEALIALLRWLREPPTGTGRARRLTLDEIWEAVKTGRERWVAFHRPDYGAPLVMSKTVLKGLARQLRRRRDPDSGWTLSEDGYVLTVTLPRGWYRLRLHRFDHATDKGAINYRLAGG